MELSRCNMSFIRRTRCIFDEHSKRCYWFGCLILLRNLLLSVLPMVIPIENRSFTILLMALSLQTTFVVEARFLPAKTKALNLTSLALGQTLVMLYLVGLAVSDPSIQADDTMSICAFVLSCGTASMIVGIFAVALLMQYQPLFDVRPFNDPYIINLLSDHCELDKLPCELGDLPCELGNKPCEFGDKPCELGNEPCELGDKPCGLGNKPCELGDLSCELGDVDKELQTHIPEERSASPDNHGLEAVSQRASENISSADSLSPDADKFCRAITPKSLQTHKLMLV